MINAYSAYVNAQGILVNGESNATITNAGSISSTSVYGNASGIEITGVNHGSISNSQTITVSSYGNGYGLRVGSDNFGDITNSGTITVHSSGSGAKGIDIAGNNYAAISNTNTNTITASSYGLAVGINISNRNENNIINSGTITAISTNNYAYGIQSDTNYGTISNTQGATITAKGYYSAGGRHTNKC